MRSLALLLAVPGISAADSTRLDLAPMPELGLLEIIHPLDRNDDERSSGGLFANIGAGYGTHGGEQGTVGEGTITIGKRIRRLSASATSSLVAGDNALVRGRHAGLLELRTNDRRSDDGELGGMLSLGGLVEHGEARALAPVNIGPGRRHHAAANADAMIRLEPDKDDMMFAALVRVDGSATRYLDSPLDRAYRGALALGAALIPEDGEVPRGRIELLTARVEHANVHHNLSAAGGALPINQVRTIEVMAGANELAGYIDRELLFAVTWRFGGVWMESDTVSPETFFKMQLGGNFKWLKRRGVRQLGFALAREPGTTPDGHHLLTEWRLEMVSAVEDSRFALSARGGITWINHQAGGEGDPDTIARYGSQLEGFIKLPLGFEIGGYHVMSYEPRVAGDPWASSREWRSEVGVLARWRGGLL